MSYLLHMVKVYIYEKALHKIKLYIIKKNIYLYLFQRNNAIRIMQTASTQDVVAPKTADVSSVSLSGTIFPSAKCTLVIWNNQNHIYIN